LLAEVLAELHRREPETVCSRFEAEDVLAPDIDSMLAGYEAAAAGFDDPALGRAVDWLLAHRPAGLADVICHGDMHPFNVLVDADGRATVLDWSAGVIAPREYDLAFTSLMLAEPPLLVPRGLRPLLRLMSSGLSRSFLRAYDHNARVRTDAAVLGWFQALVCVRALTEVAWWSAGGSLDDHAGHPWLINQSAFIRRLQRTTGVAVVPKGSAR
jgi:aminoglycoside phosphotransferase (APT) family kinase protein